MNYITIKIPAYSYERCGMIIELALNASQTGKFRVNVDGNIGAALHKNFLRVIEIMASLTSRWKCLYTYEYHLIGHYSDLNVSDARSSSVAIAIGLLTLMQTKPQVTYDEVLVATGILRVDGSIEQAHFEFEKHQSFKKACTTNEKFMTANDCHHLFILEQIINKQKEVVNEVESSTNNTDIAGEY